MTNREDAPSVQGTILEGVLSDPATQVEAAQLFIDRRSIVMDNASVFGVWIDANNSEELERVADLKQRRDEQRYATSVSAETFIERIDPNRIHRSLWHLLDPEVFTSRLGAITFVRAPGKKNLLEDGVLPDLAITPTEDGPIIQNWVPDGKDDVHHVLSVAASKGNLINPAVTSLNLTGQPEITEPEKAKEFVLTHGLALVLGGVAVRPDCEGSFTIIGFTKDVKIPVHRHGNIGVSIMRRILPEHDLVVDNGARVSKRPLQVADNQTLQGATKAAERIHTLEHLGWTTQQIGAVAAGTWQADGWPQVSQYRLDLDDMSTLRAEAFHKPPNLN